MLAKARVVLEKAPEEVGAARKLDNSLIVALAELAVHSTETRWKLFKIRVHVVL